MRPPLPTQIKDGNAWPIGGQSEVDWINERAESGRQITAAIPPLYAAYATLTNPGASDLPRDLSLERRQDLALVDVLRRNVTPRTGGWDISTPAPATSSSGKRPK